jgi:hypothetical protein
MRNHQAVRESGSAEARQPVDAQEQGDASWQSAHDRLVALWTIVHQTSGLPDSRNSGAGQS